MINQSFTGDNFRKIFDYENRKGFNLEGAFFPEIAEITQNIKACNQKYRALKKKKSAIMKEAYAEEKQKLWEQKGLLEKKKEELLTQELEKISAKVTNKGFQIKLKVVSTPSGKTAYSAENNPTSYFAIKQIQYNFQKLYKVKQSNRYEIIRQLINTLENEFPKYLIRTDIKSFYERIPRDKVLEKINKDPLLTHTSKKIVRHLLSEFERLSGSDNGLPRGVGVSAYLSELHMRSFDEAIKKHPEVVYYARYVDDIVIVFFPKAETDSSGYLEFVRKEVRKEEIGLELNDGNDDRENKTEEIDLSSPGTKTIEYLGYKIEFGTINSKPKLHLSSEKIKRNKKRIDLAFEQYEHRKKRNKKAAEKLLSKRVLFLTGNTRLIGSKNHAMVGIFYSNSLLTADSVSLVRLDDYLRNKVNVLNDGGLKRRLKRMSFKAGFAQRVFARFSTKELSEIVEAWKHES